MPVEGALSPCSNCSCERGGRVATRQSNMELGTPPMACAKRVVALLMEGAEPAAHERSEVERGGSAGFARRGGAEPL